MRGTGRCPGSPVSLPGTPMATSAITHMMNRLVVVGRVVVVVVDEPINSRLTRALAKVNRLLRRCIVKACSRIGS